MKFNNQVLPNTQKPHGVETSNFAEVPIPGRETAYRETVGGLGAKFEVPGIIYPANSAGYAILAAIQALRNGTAYLLDFEDDGPNYTCLLIRVECERQPVGNPLAIPYWLTFVKQDNPT